MRFIILNCAPLLSRHHCCRRWKYVAIFDACNSRSTENEDTSGVFADKRVGGWILARREGVGAVRRSGDQGCIHIHSLSIYLSRSLPSLPTLSCLVLSFSLILRDYCREHPGGQSVRRQLPRRRDAPFSLSLSLIFLGSLGGVHSIATLRRAPSTILFRERRRR